MGQGSERERRIFGMSDGAKMDKDAQLKWYIKVAYCPGCGHAWRVHFEKCRAYVAKGDGKGECLCTKKP